MHSIIRHCGIVCRGITHCRCSPLTSLTAHHVFQGPAVNRVLLLGASQHELHGSSGWWDIATPSKDPPPNPVINTEELKNHNVSPVTNQERSSLVGRSPSGLDTNDVAHPVVTESDHELDILSEQTEPKIIAEFADTSLMPASFSLASYAEHSEVLQKLVQLGVDLSRVEKRQNIGNELLRMKFNPDITEKIAFLHYAGVESENLGKYLTSNPHILLEDQDNLEKRVAYLKAKKFDQAAIAQIINRAPYFLCFSVERVDRRLGFYQHALGLSGDELRQIITTCPKLVTHKLTRAKDNIFLLHRQFGFHKHELKQLVLSHPRILMRGEQKLVSIFDYLHNTMDIPHKLILQNYQVFNGRAFHIQQRHQFLQKVGRAQYDPTQPGYVSLKMLVTLPEDAFCSDIAMVTLEEYNDFLKTL